MFQKLFLKISEPVCKLLAKIHWPFMFRKIEFGQVLNIEHNIEVGDVLLSRVNGEFSNILIPGKYKHAAIYVGDGWIIEAVLDGVRLSYLPDFMMTKDKIGLFKPQFANPEQRQWAADWAIGQVGKAYDYTFRSDNDRFYCFELTFAAYREALKGDSPWELREHYGVPTVVADDFIYAIEKWKCELEL